MKFIRFALAVIIFITATPLVAWDEFGHILVAELALQQLDPKVQRQIEKQSHELVKQQTSQQRLYLLRNFEDTSSFAQMAVFADTHRNLTIQELYDSFADSVPAVLRGMEAETTTLWHFKDRAFQPQVLNAPGQPEPEQCDISHPTNVSWAVTTMNAALENAETEADQTLALAMLIHFVADAHQPMHAISRVDEDCESDRGGNRFCVKYRDNSYSCEMNLHTFWDSSLGFFEGYDSVADAVEFVARVEVDEQQVDDLDPETWLAESYRMARFIYSIGEGSGGDPLYIQDGQVASYERLAMAAARLAKILEIFYPTY